MKRFLLVLVAFTVIIYLLRRLAGTTGSAAGPERRARGRRGGATPMVRDRMCNTFLPEDRALRLTRDGQTHYFCSDACRERFTASLPEGGARQVS